MGTVPEAERLAERQHRIDALAAWQATPTDLREHKSLRAFITAQGWPYTQSIRELATSTEVYHQMLVTTAGEAIPRTKAILNRLADDALAGSNKAAELYLDFVRKTITDDNLMARIGPRVDTSQVIGEAFASASKLLHLAHSIGSAEEAQAHLEANRVEQADPLDQVLIESGESRE
jgi:hypothetical protein